MLDDLDSGLEIGRLTERLLRRADVSGRLPTPVDDIVAAADLKQPSESLLTESAISDVPRHLQAAMRKLRFRVEAVLDRHAREVHVSPDIQHEGRRRFKQVHEVAHDILPWQREMGYADDNMTLSWTTRVLFEQEANQGGAELLFQRELFANMASDYKIGFGAVIDLADRFGASYHATFRRYVETHKHPMAGLVLDSSPCQREPIGYRRREAVNSPAWAERYNRTWPKVLCASPFTFIGELPRVDGLVPPRCGFSYPDLNNEPTQLQVELFTNSYRVFCLLWVPRRERLKRKRVIIPAGASP